MSKFVAINPPSQAGRMNSQGLPLWFWLPSGLTMAFLSPDADDAAGRSTRPGAGA